MTTKNRNSFSEKPLFIGLTLACLISSGLLITSFTIGGENSRLCSLTRMKRVEDYDPTPVQLQAIVHYATSKITPQQSLDEVSVSFEVLKSRSPCNFLVFGLGFDSLMWNSLNPRGTTLFLEDNPKWVQRVLKTAPMLRAHTVKYRTQVREANDLLRSWRSVAECSPSYAVLRGNTACKLALDSLPDEIYEREWDLIMIDAPKGYFPEAPGRMAAIYSAAVMARNRRGSGVTHVFLHNVDREVEKTFVQEFLCWKYFVKAVGRLGHFEIPSAANAGIESVVVGIRHPLQHLRGNAVEGLRSQGIQVDVLGEDLRSKIIEEARKSCLLVNAPLICRAASRVPFSFGLCFDLDPRLTARHGGGHTSMRVVMSWNLDLSEEANLWEMSEASTIVVTQRGARRVSRSILHRKELKL